MFRILIQRIATYLAGLILALVVVAALFWVIAVPINRAFIEEDPAAAGASHDGGPASATEQAQGVDYCQCVYEADEGEVLPALEGVGCNRNTLTIPNLDELPVCTFPVWNEDRLSEEPDYGLEQ